MKKYYYNFGYFFNRKDSGTLRIITNEFLNENDIDECIIYALKHKLIPEEYADNIIYIEGIEENEAKEMGFDIN